ncbi:MAG TPA: VanW family protein [Patescibacteria group bacterium]|nr:VanW family protein [Patescibacteria group bacterium]
MNFARLCYLSVLSIPALYLLCRTAPQARADFNLIGQEQSFAVSSSTLAAWAGRETIAPEPILATAQPVKNSLAEFLGQQPKTQQNFQTYNNRLGPVYRFVQDLARQLDHPVQEPQLAVADGRVTAFTPPQNGLTVDMRQTSLAVLQSLAGGASSSKISFFETSPSRSLSQTNTLGINQLIGEGVSNFAGSPNNRRHNIAAGLGKFQGVIVQPGKEFSFNYYLGPVTAAAGFLPELVIDNGTTQPELGGGLCQVSTTAFRAAMQAGLPITARRNHAYAVSYYSPQGTDATIYPGSADLKFVNDTPGAILIWPYLRDKNTLIFDFYGSSDGRQVTLEKPVQFDRKSDGSMKATWTRLVTAVDGTVRTDVFKSTYQPPALFHKTETYVTATGTPAGLKFQ